VQTKVRLAVYDNDNAAQTNEVVQGKRLCKTSLLFLFFNDVVTALATDHKAGHYVKQFDSIVCLKDKFDLFDWQVKNTDWLICYNFYLQQTNKTKLRTASRLASTYILVYL
jgi:hypothetical protein